jgi:hypothetical protein
VCNIDLSKVVGMVGCLTQVPYSIAATNQIAYVPDLAIFCTDPAQRPLVATLEDDPGRPGIPVGNLHDLLRRE